MHSSLLIQKSFENSNLVVYSSVTSLHGLVTVSDKRKEIVVSFRGTKLPMDFLLDVVMINVTPVEDRKIKIHKGFYIAAKSLYNQVIHVIMWISVESCKTILGKRCFGVPTSSKSYI